MGAQAAEETALKLVTVSQLVKDYGMERRTAQSLFDVVARENGEYRFRGLTRRFVARADVDARLEHIR